MTIRFITLELIFTAIWLLVRVIVWIRNKRIDIKREAMLLLMYINLAVIIRFVFFPMETVNGQIQPLYFDPARAFPFRLNLIPFTNLLRFKTARELMWNLVGNTVMFIPTGIILPILYKRLDSFWKVSLAGFLISLSIELLQLPLAERVSDVDDLILNTLGVMLGYGFYALIKRIIHIILSSNKNL